MRRRYRAGSAWQLAPKRHSPLRARAICRGLLDSATGSALNLRFFRPRGSWGTKSDAALPPTVVSWPWLGREWLAVAGLQRRSRSCTLAQNANTRRKNPLTNDDDTQVFVQNQPMCMSADIRFPHPALGPLSPAPWNGGSIPRAQTKRLGHGRGTTARRHHGGSTAISDPTVC